MQLFYSTQGISRQYRATWSPVSSSLARQCLRRVVSQPSACSCANVEPCPTGTAAVKMNRAPPFLTVSMDFLGTCTSSLYIAPPTFRCRQRELVSAPDWRGSWPMAGGKVQQSPCQLQPWQGAEHDGSSENTEPGPG